RRLAQHALEDEVLLPGPGFALGILEPDGLMEMDTAQAQDIGPAVAVEVPDIGVHAVGRIGRQGKVDGRVDLVRDLEVGALIPVRAGDDVGLAVAIEVARGDAVREVALRQDLLLEFDGGFGVLNRRERQKEEDLHTLRYTPAAPNAQKVTVTF